jgi:hypothetical protein
MKNCVKSHLKFQFFEEIENFCHFNHTTKACLGAVCTSLYTDDSCNVNTIFLYEYELQSECAYCMTHAE